MVCDCNGCVSIPSLAPGAVCDGPAPSRDAEMSGTASSELLFVQCFSVCRTEEELLGHGPAPAVISHLAVRDKPRGMLNKSLFHALPALDILSYCDLNCPANLCSFCISTMLHSPLLSKIMCRKSWSVRVNTWLTRGGLTHQLNLAPEAMLALLLLTSCPSLVFMCEKLMKLPCEQR